MKRGAIEIGAVATAAAVFIVVFLLLPKPVHVKIGNDVWTSSWGTAMEAAPAGSVAVAPGSKFTETVDLPIGGRALNLTISNQYGTGPLTLKDIAVSGYRAGQSTAYATKHVDFGEQSTVTIDAGNMSTSDPVPITTPPGSTLALRATIVGSAPQPTFHPHGAHQSVITDPHGTATTTSSWLWWSRVDVLGPPGAHATAVVLGDGSSDWTQSTPISADLQHVIGDGTAIINESLAGNSASDIGCTTCGEAMVERVIRDTVDLPGTKVAIVAAGGEDISRGASAAAVIHGLSSIAAILHVHGIHAVALTLPTMLGGHDQTTATIHRLQTVNQWLRDTPPSKDSFDSVLDVDRLITQGAASVTVSGLGLSSAEVADLAATTRNFITANIPIPR